LYDKTVYDLKAGLHEDVILLEPTSGGRNYWQLRRVLTAFAVEDPFPLVMLEAALAAKLILVSIKPAAAWKMSGNTYLM
jgi:hypothetical protein